MFESVYLGSLSPLLPGQKWPVYMYLSPKSKVDHLALIIIYTPLDRLRYSSEPMVMLLVPAVL